MGKSLVNILNDAVRIATGTSSFSPDRFRKQFKDGFGRPNLFQFKLKRMPNVFSATPNLKSPASLGSVASELATVGLHSASAVGLISEGLNIYNMFNGGITRDLTFRISKAQLPNRIVESYNISYNGPGFRMPREINNDSIQIEVMCSGDYWEHQMFTSWQNAILDYGKTSDEFTYDVSYFDDIVTEAELFLFNDNGDITYKVFFDKLWPEVVGGENLDWSRKDSISSFPVTLNYSTATVSMSGGENKLLDYVPLAHTIINQFR